MKNHLILSFLFLIAFLSFAFLPLVKVSAFPPIASNDSVETTVNTSINISVKNILENDISGSAELDLTSIQVPQKNNDLQNTIHGELKDKQNEIIYTPSEDFKGVDKFEYRICNAYKLCDKATVTIKVTTQKIIAGIEIAGKKVGCTEITTASTLAVLISCTAPKKQLLGYVYGYNIIRGGRGGVLSNSHNYYSWLIIVAIISLFTSFLTGIVDKYSYALLGSLVALGLLVSFYLVFNKQLLPKDSDGLTVSLGYGFWVMLVLVVFITVVVIVASLSQRKSG